MSPAARHDLKSLVTRNARPLVNHHPITVSHLTQTYVVGTLDREDVDDCARLILSAAGELPGAESMGVLIDLSTCGDIASDVPSRCWPSLMSLLGVMVRVRRVALLGAAAWMAPLIRKVNRLLPTTQIRRFTTARVGAARAWASAQIPPPERSMTQLFGTPASQHGRPPIVAFALWTPPTLADMDDLHQAIRSHETVSLLLPSIRTERFRWPHSPRRYSPPTARRCEG